MYSYLAATSETLRQFVLAGLRADVGPSGLAAFFNGVLQVSLATPHEMAAGNPPTKRLSLWPYRIVRDESRRYRLADGVDTDALERRLLRRGRATFPKNQARSQACQLH